MQITLSLRYTLTGKLFNQVFLPQSLPLTTATRWPVSQIYRTNFFSKLHSGSAQALNVTLEHYFVSVIHHACSTMLRNRHYIPVFEWLSTHQILSRISSCSFEPYLIIPRQLKRLKSSRCSMTGDYVTCGLLLDKMQSSWYCQH